MRAQAIATRGPAGLHRTFKAGLFAFCMALSGIGSAAAAEFYLGLHGGLSFTDDDEFRGDTIRYDTGYGYGVAAGVAFDSILRLELEATCRKNREKKSVSGQSNDSLVSVALLGNIYFPVELGSGWTPYFGLGTGLAIFGGEGSTLPFARVAYQLGAGVGYDINESLTVSMDYRALYSDTGEGVLESSDGDYLNQSIWLGLRYGI
jgi:opacity protein-like surface antigen